MSNKYDHHLVVIPEDEANRQILTGFSNHLNVNARRIHIDPVAGGWLKTLEKFHSDHVLPMQKYSKRHALLVIDCDNDLERIQYARKQIPDHLKDRVHILGLRSEPEAVRRETGLTKEKLGEALAESCLADDKGLWSNELLLHNLEELERMKQQICPHLRA